MEEEAPSDEVRQLRDDNTQLRGENAQLREENAQLRSDNALLQGQIRQVSCLVEGIQRQMAQTLTLLAETRAELTATRAELKTARAQIARLSGKEPPPDEPSALAPVEPPADEGVSPPPPGQSDKNRERRQKRKRRNAGTKPKRGPLPAHLERITQTVCVPDCPHCASDDLFVYDEEISEKLGYIPARVVVYCLARQKVRCKDCTKLTRAAMPPTAVPYGQMHSSLLAHLIYSKCGLHLPLSRISEDLARTGVELASATLSDALGHGAELLTPIADRLLERALLQGLVQLDGTGLTALEPGQKGAHLGQMNVLCTEGEEPISYYHYSESKDGHHFTTLLRVGTKQTYRGLLVADAGSNFNGLFLDGNIQECGCWQHVRDHFVEARPGTPFEAEEGIAYIRVLFDIERESEQAREGPDARLIRRQRESAPILVLLKKWMDRIQPKFLPDEELRKAIQYIRNHEAAFWRFLSDGRIPLSNNLSERELGVIGRGRKNYLFAGSDEGGERLGVLYTVVRTCQRQEIDPWAYLDWVLPQLSDLPVNRIPGILPTLLPGAFKKAYQQAPTG